MFLSKYILRFNIYFLVNKSDFVIVLEHDLLYGKKDGFSI